MSMAADILAILRRIGAGRSTRQVVAELLRYAGEEFEVDRVSLLLPDDLGRLQPFAAEYTSGQVDREMFDAWRALDLEGADLVRRVRDGEDVVLAEDPAATGAFSSEIARRFELGPLLALALRDDQTLEGLLIVEAPVERLRARADDAAVFRDHLALALANTRAYERENARAAQAEALLEVSRVLARTTELTPVLAAVAQQAARVAGFERCSLFLVDPDARRLVPTMSQFADGHADPEAWNAFVSNDADLPVAWEVMRTGEPIVVHDPARHPDLMPPSWYEPFGIVTVLYVPLVAWDETLGALVLDHRHRTNVTTQQLRTAQAVAGQGAVAIAVGRLLAQLLDTNRELELADRAKDDFLSMISHELRSPVAAVLGFAQTLEHAWDRLDDARRVELLARIRRSAQRQDRMIDDLLNTSLIAHGELETRPRDVTLDQVVVDTVTNLQLDPDTVEVAVDGHRVHADPDHVRQIVSNLLTNAVKYGAPPYRLRAEQGPGGFVRLYVRDHGPGVPEGFVPHLFGRFTQASRGDRRIASGVGLGLSIAQRLARASGGELRYQRPDGPGAMFVLDLPGASAT
jgi:signal transduction histidine kinase